MTAIDAVLLVAFGGPEGPEDVRPFLERVAAGRPIPPGRLDEVAHHYARIGGRSPLNELTRRQAAALRDALARDGAPLPVYVGMRNWHPYLHEALAEINGRGLRRVLAVILSSLQTEVSWDRYAADVRAARARVGPAAPEVVCAPAWAGHPLFVACMAERVRAALGALPAERRSAAHVVFTAHSVPVAMAEGSPYAAQLCAAGRRIAAAAGHARWSVAYQSRSGGPREPWLEPDITDALRALAREGARDVAVAPVGFVCDHVEVLYDLDVEAAEVARGLGLGFTRAATANDHPLFVAMLADVVRRSLTPAAP